VLLAVGRDDLAHAFYATDAVVSARWARRTGRPAVFTYAGLPERATLAGRRDGIAIAVDATRGSAAVVTLSRAARDALWRWLRVEGEIIAPGVDLDAFSPGGGRSPAPRLLCPAALEPRKRGDLLLAAFARVRRRRPDATLVLQRPRDPAAAAALQREDGVVLAGLDDHAALVREYRAAWVTVLASRAEAFGLVVAESLACGTPAVAAADGGAADIVADEDVGRTFAGEDPEALAAAIEAALELAAAPETGAACRARAADFSQDRATAAHLALYQRLLRA
jgi:D-inositol-3-phosphate glycosyltransferase